MKTYEMPSPKFIMWRIVNRIMDKRKTRLFIFDIVLFAVLVAIDQLTKYAAVLRLKGQAPIPLLKGILEFNYLENRGAAFGLLQNQKVFFVIVAVVFLSVITYVVIKAPGEKKYDKLNLLLVIIAAGAVGNLIDRLRADYVVDFIYIVLIDFPIFNVADMYVTFSAAFLVFQILFVYKDNDFYFLNLHRKTLGDEKYEPK